MSAPSVPLFLYLFSDLSSILALFFSSFYSKPSIYFSSKLLGSISFSFSFLLLVVYGELCDFVDSINNYVLISYKLLITFIVFVCNVSIYLYVCSELNEQL
jgi:hypothetical protein